MDNRKKLKISIIVTAAVLLLSFGYRLSIGSFYSNPENLPEAAKGKDVVSFWVKDEFGAQEIKSRIDKFNSENKNIYIDYKIYGKDYYNLLRLSMLSKNKPDIFEFGFYDFLEDNNLYSLDELGVDKGLIDKNRFLNYKGTAMGVKVFGNDVKLLVNREMLKECGINPDSAPKTMDDIIKLGEALKAKFPNSTPFEFPLSNYAEIKASIGEPSVPFGTIYTSFWDYKNARYDFSYAKTILTFYNQLYLKGLIPKDFYLKDKKAVRADFYNKKSAVIISTYEDKNYFEAQPLNFTVSLYDLPQDKFYYTDGINCIVASKNDNNKEAVKQVYQWLIAQYGDISGAASITGGPLCGYEKRGSFKFEEKDPTDSLKISHQNAYKYFYDAIEGKISIDDAVNNLNKFFNYYVDYRLKLDPNYFDYYIEKE